MLLYTLFAAGLLLSGCADSLHPKVKPSSVKILKNAIEVEFNELTREFDLIDQKGDLALCAPLHFGVARFAVYQAVEEKRTATMAQLTRFIIRARAAIKRAEEKMKKNQCVDQDGDGLTDLVENHKYNTQPDNADTDGDEVSDTLEIRRYRTNPLKADTDGDLLDDGDEISRGLNPLLTDSDGDGYIDGIEIAQGSNARDACSQPLDAQNLDRLHECRPKRIHAKPVQAKTPQERTPVTTLKTKQISDKKRLHKAEKPKTKPASSSSPKRHRKPEKVKFEDRKLKPSITSNGAYPGQKNQVPRTLQENTTTSSDNAAPASSDLHHANVNHNEILIPIRPKANQHETSKTNLEEKPGKANREEPQVHAPLTVSLAENHEKPEKPAEASSVPQFPKPALKKRFPPSNEKFPSAIFMRLW